MTIIFFFYLGKKAFKEIELIVTFIQVTNLVKRTTGINEDLEMIMGKKRLL